jgi:hypothetical protein
MGPASDSFAFGGLCSAVSDEQPNAPVAGRDAFMATNDQRPGGGGRGTAFDIRDLPFGAQFDSIPASKSCRDIGDHRRLPHRTSPDLKWNRVPGRCQRRSRPYGAGSAPARDGVPLL